MRTRWATRLFLIGGYLLDALFGLWGWFKIVMDWNGRSTFFEDLSASERALVWLFSTPAWVPGALFAALTAWLIWRTWPEARPAQAPERSPGMAATALEAPKSLTLEEDLMPISEAARIAYEETISAPFAMMARNQAKGNPDAILKYYAGLLTGYGEPPGMTAYGQQPPSTRLAMITREDFKGCSFIEDGSKLRQIADRTIIEFANIHVRRSELQERISQVRKI